MANRQLTTLTYDGKSWVDPAVAVKSANEAALDLLKLAGISVEDLDSVTASMLRRVVPWVFRCIQLRADALSRLPFTITTLGGDSVEWFLEKKLRRLLWLSEASLCSDGAAYWYKVPSLATAMSIAGASASPAALKWCAVPTITVETNDRIGLTGFTRRAGTLTETWRPDQVVYLWLPDPAVEVGPGTSPAQVALTAATVSMNIDLYASAFFKRGAINPLIITLLGSVGEQEKNRVQEWFKRVATGIRRAFAAIAVSNDVKITPVGSPVKDLAMPELDTGTKQKVCAALGLHPSLLEQSANYATAQESRLSFYQDTIIPEAGWIEPELNDQLFGPLGMMITFHPETLEIMQQEETDRAAAFESYVRGGLPIDWVGQMLGLEPPEGHTWEELDGPEPAPVEAPATSPLLLPAGVAAEDAAIPKALLSDLRKWQHKAEKRGVGVAFESDVIPLALKAAIVQRLGERPERAWDFLKQDDALRLDEEELIRAAVAKVFADYQEVTARAIVAGEAVDYDALSAALRSALTVVISDLVTEETLRLAATIGIDFDVAVINAAAVDWARTYTYELVTGLTDTTRKIVTNAITHFTNTPGMTIGQVRSLLDPAFGPVRAQMISVTETTRAYANATNFYQNELRDMGVETERFWVTSADEKVCPVCGPLNGKGEDVWIALYPEGPAAHVNCRCHTRLRLKKP